MLSESPSSPDVDFVRAAVERDREEFRGCRMRVYEDSPGYWQVSVFMDDDDGEFVYAIVPRRGRGFQRGFRLSAVS